MVSTFFGLETSTRGITANQDALDVISQNVDNANTPGYTRQVADLTTTKPISLTGSGSPTTLIGTGVQVASITRDRNGFLDTQYRQQNAVVGQWTVDQTTLNEITGIINEPSSTGLSSAMATFWSDWSQLGSNPGNLSAADQLQQDAQTVTSTLNQMSQQMTQTANDLGLNESPTSQLSTQMQQVNTYLQQLADINHQISDASQSGAKPNDLLDQRDLLVDKLSNLVDVHTTDTNGVYTLTIGNNTSPAVVGQNVMQNMAFADQAGNLPAGIQAIDPSTVTGGQIKGITDSIQTVQQYQDSLNAFAQQLATGTVSVPLDGDLQFPASAGTLPVAITVNGTQYPAGTSLSNLPSSTGVTVDNSTGLATIPSGTTVTVNGLNGLLQLGYAQAGQTTYPNTSLQFFQAGNGAATGDPITAANITVGASAEQISYAMRPQVSTSGGTTTYSALSGDGTLAMTASDLKTGQFSFSNAANPLLNMNGTLDQFLQAQVGELGIQSQTANNQMTNQTSLLQQIDNQRKSVSSVDLNQEMSNMIEYQQGYNASAKMVTTIQSLFDTLMQAF